MVSTARRVALCLFALSGFIVMADTAAMATKIVHISGRHSKDEIKSTCDKVGGAFDDAGGGYGCSKLCTPKGGRCTVGCFPNGKCTGGTPIRVKPRSSPVIGTAGIEQVLRGRPVRVGRSHSPTATQTAGHIRP